MGTEAAYPRGSRTLESTQDKAGSAPPPISLSLPHSLTSSTTLLAQSTCEEPPQTLAAAVASRTFLKLDPLVNSSLLPFHCASLYKGRPGKREVKFDQGVKLIQNAELILLVTDTPERMK